MFSFFASAKANSTPAPDAAAGIEGVITISPIQPGPIRQGVPDSKPLPNTDFVVQNEKGAVTTFTTDDQGKFRVSLPAGHYTVSMKGKKGGIGRFGPFDVDVVPGKMTKVNWECDTGIR
jgi:hypothetical protein